MTRSDKGRRHHSWSTAELDYIREHAGRVPAREIRRALKLSKNQFDNAVRTMVANGERISARCFTPRTAVCPSCGCARSLFGKEGICEPCRLRRRLAEVEADCSALLAMLTASERETYGGTEAERGGRASDPMPVRRPTAGLDPYRAAKAEEDYDLAMERWASRTLRRRLKAAQKRKERISKKVGKDRRYLLLSQNSR